ncbi:MAG: tetratricopeptide repeat protein [Gammaproteobacteria bacterium]|nr:tetratricopeptide repeat protein [Gammaproteobacteria bacterium]
MALGQLLLAARAEVNQNHRVIDRGYGQALYQHFQQNNLGAITALMVAGKQPQTNRQQDQSDLLLADLYYQYGLYDESDQLFSRLLADNIDRTLLTRLWFNLARLNHDRGEHEKALELLLRIESPLPDQLQNEKQYLLGKLFIINGFIDDAIISLQTIDQKSIWYHYARYNLGVSLLEDGQFDDGISMLNAIGQLKNTTGELSALRDRANLSMGLSQLRVNQPGAALQSLQKIRLQGPFSNTALLATGWGWTALEQSGKALVPWLELASRNTIDAATQEAILAIPTRLEQANKPKLAIQYYKLAAGQFDKQIEILEQAIKAINAGELISLLGQNALIYDHEKFAVSTLQSDSAAYLHIVIASAEFHQTLKRYQELVDISSTLNHWKLTLPTLDLMLEERRQRFIDKLPLLEQTASFQNLGVLRQSRDDLASQLKLVANNQSSLELAGEKQKSQLQRLDKVAASLNRIGDLRDTSDQRDMHRLMSGLVTWQVRTSYASRLWTTKKQLKQLDQSLSNASTRVATLQKVNADSISRFDQFQTRINTQQNKIGGLLSRVADLIDRQEARINNSAIATIEAQKQHLVQLRLNSQYALARLYDKVVNE